jgi:protein tyrosine phosphatase
MWIQNVGIYEITRGMHYLDNKTILIQIQDVGTWEFAKPFYKDKFIEIHQFEFQDTEKDVEEAGPIQDHQAKAIADILMRAKETDKNIVVHCHAGICRSGAVVECGVIMGFQEPENERIPNVLVKKKILKHLGLTNSWDDDEIEYCPTCGDEWSGTSCGANECGWIVGGEE